MDVEILPILCVGQTHWFVPTGGHTMACPYDIVLCVFGGRCMQRSYNKLGAGILPLYRFGFADMARHVPTIILYVFRTRRAASLLITH